MSLFFHPPRPPAHSSSSPDSSSSAALPTLTTLYLQPLSARSSSLAQSSPDVVLEALSSRVGRVVRTGEVISLPRAGSSSQGELVAFRVVMTEPVLMGVVALEGDEPTEVVVGPHTSDGHEGDSSSPHASSSASRPERSPASDDDSDRTVHPRSQTDWDDQDDDFDADDDVEISASFLQQALLVPPPSSGPSSSQSSTSLSPSPSSPAFPHPAASSSGLSRLSPHALERPPSSRRGSHRTGPPSDEDETVGWVRTRTLGEIGAFDGDWVAVRSEDPDDQQSASSSSPAADWRILRICARDDDDGQDSGGSSSSASSIQVSPLFLHNLAPLYTSHTPQLIILPAPFAPSSSRPPLPTATSVTLARLASPASTNKLLQSQVVNALRRYFDSGLRALKVGDVFGVGIGEFDLKEESEDAEDETANAPDTDAPVPTTTVCFVVTKADLPAPPLSSTSSGRETWDLKAARGDFGCFVDPAVTQLVQAGVKRGVGIGGTFPKWIGIGGLLPPLTTLPPAVTLRELVASSLVSSMSSYDLDLSVLVKGSRGSGKRTIVRSVAAASGLGVMEINCFDVIGETDAKTEGVLRARFERASGCSPCVLLLRNIEALARKGQVLETGKEPQIATVLRECIDGLSAVWKSSGYPVLVLGTTSDPEKVPLGILACFKREIAVEAPDERQRLDILKSVLAQTPVAADVDLSSIAVQTAALVAQDIVSLVARAKRAAVQRLRVIGSIPSSSTSSNSLHSFALAGVALSAADLTTAIDDARTAYSQSIGAPKIPNVTWDDVGGLAHVKTEILDTIELPLNHPELFAAGLKKRSGILLYGPPGTGKTLLAKAVATSCSLNFFSVKGPELLNMYIGESEANVRRVFQRARDAKPCVIFFDELDSVAPKRGNQGDSGGVMDRIVSQLLAELDGMTDGENGGGGVFVIGATNRPDLLDPALLRPGRFDRMLYLGVSDTHQAQQNILEALTRKFKLDPALDLSAIAQQCPFNYTGADFYALCSDAMLKAMSRTASQIDAKLAVLNAETPDPESKHPHPMTPQYYLSELATQEEIAVLVGKRDFEEALEELVPSVSGAEMEHYRRVQAEFSPVKVEAREENGSGVGRWEEGRGGEVDGRQTVGELGAVLVNGKGKGKGKARA